MSKNNNSLTLILGTAVGVALVGIAAILYSRSHGDNHPIRTVQEALAEAREKIHEIENQLSMRGSPA